MSREVCGICWCPYDEDTGACACAPVQPRGAMTRDEIIRMARWKQIPSFPDYDVSDCGMVRRGDKLLSQRSLNVKGYPRVSMSINGKCITRVVHALVFKNPEQALRSAWDAGAAAERNAILQMSREQWFKTQADFEEAIRAREKQG